MYTNTAHRVVQNNTGVWLTIHHVLDAISIKGVPTRAQSMVVDMWDRKLILREDVEITRMYLFYEVKFKALRREGISTAGYSTAASTVASFVCRGKIISEICQRITLATAATYETVNKLEVVDEHRRSERVRLKLKIRRTALSLCINSEILFSRVAPLPNRFQNFNYNRGSPRRILDLSSARARVVVA